MILPDFTMEKKLLDQGYQIIAGVDESGRGSLAGPIVAAAVIFPPNFNTNNCPVADSKKLSPQKRKKLFKIIIKKSLSFKIALIKNNKIDQQGIEWANCKVIKKAVLGLKIKPQYILTDGMRTKINWQTPNKSINKADETIFSVAAASILAKVSRDKLMRKIAKKYPQYEFEKHKGYGTKSHLDKIKKYGPCKIHRQSYTPIKKYGPK